MNSMTLVEQAAAKVDALMDFDTLEPLPIPDDLLPVKAFDYKLLPDSIRPWIVDISERMQCPPDFPAVAAMVALSSVIGRKACLQPKRFDDWKIMPNLWGMVVGRPGVKKSPALSQALAPLGRLGIAAKESHDDAMREFLIDTQLNEMTADSASKKAKALVGKGDTEAARRVLMSASEDDGTPTPTLRRYKVNDSTVEALGEILIENPNGVLAYRDELNGLLRSMDQEGQESARAFYLQAYDGDQGYTFDRIMRGRNLHIPAVCIALLGGIQPGKLQSYINDAVRGGAGDDGLLQRFGLLVWPDIEGEWKNVDRWPDTRAKTAAFEVFHNLDRLEAGIDPDTEQAAPRVHKFTDEAQKIFDGWQHDHHNDMRSSERHEALASHYAKYEKLAGALALVCSLSDGETKVSDTSLLRALAWCDYLRTHAERAYAAGIKSSSEPAKALLSKIRTGGVSDGFTARNVYLKGWSHLGTPEAVRAAAELLVDLNHLFEDQQGSGTSGGRPTTRYKINPATLRG